MNKKEKLREYYLYIADHVNNVKSSYYKYEDLFFKILNHTKDTLCLQIIQIET